MSSQTQCEACCINSVWQTGDYKAQSQLPGCALSAQKITSLCLHKEPSVVSSAEIPPDHCAPLQQFKSKFCARRWPHGHAKCDCCVITQTVALLWATCRPVDLTWWRLLHEIQPWTLCTFYWFIELSSRFGKIYTRVSCGRKSLSLYPEILWESAKPSKNCWNPFVCTHTHTHLFHFQTGNITQGWLTGGDQWRQYKRNPQCSVHVISCIKSMHETAQTGHLLAQYKPLLIAGYTPENLAAL